MSQLLYRALIVVGLLGSAAGCDAVVGAQCAASLDPCGRICCAEGFACNEDLMCVLRPSEDYDGGLLGPWNRPQDAGEDAESDAGFPDAGTPDGHSPDANKDGGQTDADSDAGFPDADSDAGFPDADSDAGFPDADSDAGLPDADAGAPDADAGTPDADAGAPDADAGTPDADAGTPDAGAPDADAGAPDGGPICPLGTQLCGAQCVDTLSDTSHCGGCNLACTAMEFCNAGTCAPTCTAPRTQCPGGCFYVQNDPNNCGTCGNACGSNVCYQGGCVAPSAGHVVVIGHDMRSTHPATVNIAGNAVFLPVQSPLTVGIFRERTWSSTEQAINTVISGAATQLNRTYSTDIMLASEVTQRLANVDVFVIYPQEASNDAELMGWGTDWSLALQAFVRRGGTVVLFDAGGIHQGAWQILAGAGLFAASGRTALANGTIVDVVSPADALVRGAPLSYPAPNTTMTFTSTLTDVVVETRALPAAPVIFHRVVVP